MPLAQAFPNTAACTRIICARGMDVCKEFMGISALRAVNCDVRRVNNCVAVSELHCAL